MDEDYEIEIIRRVFDNSDGVSLVIGQDPDGLGSIHIRTEDSASKQRFGDVDIFLTTKMARLLAEAIYSCAGELEKKNGK